MEYFFYCACIRENCVAGNGFLQVSFKNLSHGQVLSLFSFVQ